MLDGMLFSGPLSLKRNRDLQQWIRLRVVIRMNLVCTAFFLYMFKFQVSSFICHIHDYTEIV